MSSVSMLEKLARAFTVCSHDNVLLTESPNSYRECQVVWENARTGGQVEVNAEKSI